MSLNPRSAADAVHLVLTATAEHNMPLGTLMIDDEEISFRSKPRLSPEQAETLVRAIAGENASIICQNFPPNPLNNGGFSAISGSMRIGEERIGLCVYAAYRTPEPAEASPTVTA
jgi:hypothetical protein